VARRSRSGRAGYLAVRDSWRIAELASMAKYSSRLYRRCGPAINPTSGLTGRNVPDPITHAVRRAAAGLGERCSESRRSLNGLQPSASCTDTERAQQVRRKRSLHEYVARSGMPASWCAFHAGRSDGPRYATTWTGMREPEQIPVPLLDRLRKPDGRDHPPLPVRDRDRADERGERHAQAHAIRYERRRRAGGGRGDDGARPRRTPRPSIRA
jgi:hypothetical protein